MPNLPEVSSSSPPTVSLPSRRVVQVLASVAAILLLASIAGQVVKYGFGHDHVFGLVRLFNVDDEMNLPTWYASMTLAASSVLLALIGFARRTAGKADSWYWLGLSLVFLYVSADEAAFMHELLNPVLRQSLVLPGLLYYGWVSAGIVVVAVGGLLYARFVWRLPRPIRRAFILAAALYLGGALGVEMLGAAHAYRYGVDNLGYSIWTTIEEALEMAGVIVFIHGLLRQLEADGPVLLRSTRG